MKKVLYHRGHILSPLIVLTLKKKAVRFECRLLRFTVEFE